MGVSQWDSYATGLANLGQWDAVGVVAEDIRARAQANPASVAVVQQSLQLLKATWRTMPAGVRSMVLSQLNMALDAVGETWDAVGGALGDIPIANLVVGAIDGVATIAGAFKGVGDVKRHASAYEKGRAQRFTLTSKLQGVGAPSGGFFTVLPMYEYAKYIKVRAGGDFDRLPAWARKAQARDAIFSGAVSAPGSGCAKEMRRSFGDSYGPFSPKCGRQIGVSALFFPWWSTAYSPGMILRYEGSPPGSVFDLGLSPDNNSYLIGIQTGLITDPTKNAQANLGLLKLKVQRFKSWWGEADALRPLRERKTSWGGADLVVSPSSDSRRIDASKNPAHVPSKDAGAFWYYDEFGAITAYPGQTGAGLDDWGVMLPQGDPADLAVSAAMHNGVLAMLAAFSERRLATIRSPRMAEAIIADEGLGSIDSGARAAFQHSASVAASVLPYPGASTPKRKVFQPGGELPPRRGVLSKPGAIGGGGMGAIAPLALASLAGYALLRR